MAMEAKVSASATPFHPSLAATHQARSDAWQSEMNTALEAFLAGIKAQLIQSHQLKPRPVVLSYVKQFDLECFIECAFLATDPANPDRNKLNKFLATVKKSGVLLFERAGNTWHMHYRDQQLVASLPIDDPAQIADLEEIGRSNDLAGGFSVYDPGHLQTIIQIVELLSPEAAEQVKRVDVSEVASELTRYLSAAGISVIDHPLDIDDPKVQIAALKRQLDKHRDTQVIVLCTPVYRALAHQGNKLLSQRLTGFGQGKKDSVLPLRCLGGFGVASGIVPNRFLFRDYEPALKAFDGPHGGMPAFLEVFVALSSQSSGLGLLPDLLDLENARYSHQKGIYDKLFNVLSQTQARLTVDYVLEESLDEQLNTHPLRRYYGELQGLYASEAGEEKQVDTGVSVAVPRFLSDARAKTALLLAPSLMDTELSGIAVIEVLRQQTNSPRIIIIDLAQYPGNQAHRCIEATLQQTLKLTQSTIERLKGRTLGDAQSRPTIFVFKNYQHTNQYDNLYLQNALASWPGAKVIVTCIQDYFSRHDARLCFLSDPSSPDFASLQQTILTSFGENPHDSQVLKQSDLPPRQRIQQQLLNGFLNQIATLSCFLPSNTRKVFISYAWEPDKDELARQQRHLRQIVQDLERAGFPTWLDVQRMTGDITTQMRENIQHSHYALIIGTPRYTQRATVLGWDGKPTNVKREYDDILQGYQEKRLEAIALRFLPEGPFDGANSAHYASFPNTLPADMPSLDLADIDDFEQYIQQLTDEQHGLLPKLLHLAERSQAAQAHYREAKATLTHALASLPIQLILSQAEQDQATYDISKRRSLYIEARGKAEHKDNSPDFGLTAQFDAFLSTEAEESKNEEISLGKAATFIALGMGGSGKSLFSQIQYARLLEKWQASRSSSHQKTSGRGRDIFIPAWIPIYIPLKHYVGRYEDTPENRAANRVGKARVNTCVEAALRTIYHLSDRDIEILKTGSGQGLGVLLILDGYDELAGERPNLYQLNGLAQWTCPIKLLITSRMDYIPDPDQHKSYFGIQGQNTFVRSYIQPFSAEDIRRYIQLYEAQELIRKSQEQAARDVASGILNAPAAPQADTYQTLAALLGLLDLVTNPFLLNLVLQGLPYLQAERLRAQNDLRAQATRLQEAVEYPAQDNTPITRLEIYDSFSQYWFGKEVYRLIQRDDPDLRLRFEQHAERLAFQLFLNQQLSVSQNRAEDAELWHAFFNSDDLQTAQARAALPLRDTGDQQYEFMHKTLFEYFVTRHLVNAYFGHVSGEPQTNPKALGKALSARPPAHKVRYAAGVPLPVQDAGVFSFLSEAIESSYRGGSFKTALFEQVTRSRIPSPLVGEGVAQQRMRDERFAANFPEYQAEPAMSKPLGLAAAHAATILTKTGTSMANQAWAGVQLPGADLGLATLAYTDLSGANLQSAYLAGTFLRDANLREANLQNLRFMEYPKIKLQKPVHCVAFCSSRIENQAKSWILSGQGNQVVIIDSETKQVMARGEGHTNSVGCVAFNSASNRVVSGSWDYTLRLWAIGKGMYGDLVSQAVLKGHKYPVQCCAFSSTGDRIVSGAGQEDYYSESELLLWAVGGEIRGELTPQAVLREGFGYVRSCAFSPAGNWVVSDDGGSVLQLWAIDGEVHGELAPRASLVGHENSVLTCAFSPAGDRVVSGSEDRTLRLWAVGSGIQGKLYPQAVLRGHRDRVMACAFSPTGDRIVSGSWDNTLCLWTVSGEVYGDLSPQVVLRGHKDSVNCCAFNPTGDLVVSSESHYSFKGGELRFWAVAGDMHGGELAPQPILRGHDRRIVYCAFSPTGDLVASGSNDGVLCVWSVGGEMHNELALQVVLNGDKLGIESCAFTPTSDRVMSVGWNDTLQVWAVDGGVRGKLVSQVILKGYIGCAFSPAGDRVVSKSDRVVSKSDRVVSKRRGEDNTLQLWAVGGGEMDGELALLVVLRGHEDSAHSFAFSLPGDRLVSGSWDGTLRLWAVGGNVQGELFPQAILRGHKKSVWACAFSPAGDRVVSGSEDKTLCLWWVGADVSGELTPQVVLVGHTDSVRACAFSPNGDWVVSGSMDKTLRLWDISDLDKVSCVQILKWCAGITALDIYPKNYDVTASFAQVVKASMRQTKNPMSVRIVVGDEAGFMSVWQLENKQLCFIGMPPQPEMREVWRATWQTVKLAGAQMTPPDRALLEQYRDMPLSVEEGMEDGVQVVTDMADEILAQKLDQDLKESVGITVDARDEEKDQVQLAAGGMSAARILSVAQELEENENTEESSSVEGSEDEEDKVQSAAAISAVRALPAASKSKQDSANLRAPQGPVQFLPPPRPRPQPAPPKSKTKATKRISAAAEKKGCMIS